MTPEELPEDVPALHESMYFNSAPTAADVDPVLDAIGDHL
jgi:hypothetical protein